jgi:hypothetical protein
MTDNEKVEHIARNFDQLSENQKGYIKNLSQALYFIQNPYSLMQPTQDIFAVQENNDEKGILHGIFKQSANSPYVRRDPIKGGAS